MSKEGEGKVVCVTGASGYVASWLVKLLLHRGYTVKATVRNLSDPRRTEHLRALEGAEERLELFEANLLEEGSFDSAVHGCAGVFHTASPVISVSTDPQAELIDPAVKGTLNVLGSCAKTRSVRRVVLTSSIATAIYNGKPICPDVVIDETWFSNTALCKEHKDWYGLAKTLAEEAACKFAQENGIDLIVMNPGLVIGPLLQPTLNMSSQFFLYVIKGLADFPHRQCVDVRDVGYAHILGFENSKASGRYLLVAKTVTPSYLLHLLHKLFPSIIAAPTSDTENLIGDTTSRKKAESLGVSFMDVEESIKDTTESLEELIDPEVKETLNVLKSCAKTKSVRRVVLTSSTATAIQNGKPICPDDVIDETWLCDPDVCKENKDWYGLAKTLAEEAACKFAQENGIDLIVMNPGFVLGPLLQPTLNMSSQIFLYIVKGSAVFPYYPCVDVRDVGHAHILGFENSSATGRYLVVAKTLTHLYLLHLLHKLCPSIFDASIGEEENSIGDVTSRKKADNLGVSFMNVEVSFKDTIESSMEKNFLNAN